MQRERRTIWSMVRMMLWALSAVALVACIREDLIDDPDDPDAPENVVEAGNYDLYFQIQYDAAPETRVSGSSGEDSGSLENGSHDEHEIGRTGNFVLLFFANPDTGKEGDEKYVLRDLLPLTLEERWSDSDKAEDLEEGSTATPEAPEMPEIPDREPDKGKVETIFRSRINVDPKDLPKKCLVILNGTPFYERLVRLRNDRASLKEVLEMTWDNAENPRLIGRDGNRFVMTNAAYEVEEVDAEGKVVGKKLQIATDLGDMKNLRQYLFIEGERNRRKKALRIYVERMVAKFTFTIKADTEKYGSSDYIVPLDDGTYYIYPQKVDANRYEDRNYDEIWVFTGFDKDGIQKVAKRKWRVHVTGWGINALETSAYLFKNLHYENGMQDFNIDKSWNWNWNDANNHRSYWAKDPHYDQSLVELKKYPWQYRDALDAPDMPPSYSSRIGESKLSYTDEPPILLNEDFEYFSRDMKIDRTVYVPENTYDFYCNNYKDLYYEPMLDKREHLLAGTHLLVCAELQVATKENPTENDYKTFTGYRDRIGNFYWGKLNPKETDNVADEPWKSTTQAPWRSQEGVSIETQNNTRNCFIRLMRTFNYYLSSQKEMFYRYYQWPNADDQLEPKPDDINLGDEFYAKPESSPASNSDPNVIGHEYEICLENENRSLTSSRRVTRLFDDNNDYQLDDVDQNFEFFVPGRIKDGDGKVLPWLKKNEGINLRIFDIVKKRDPSDPNNAEKYYTEIEEAQIPVYKYSDAQIAKMVDDYIAKIRKAWNDGDYANYPKPWWVDTATDEEVYFAIMRDRCQRKLFGEDVEGISDKDVTKLETHNVTVNDRRSMLFDWLNTVDYFEDGMMYYAMEIKNPDGKGEEKYQKSPYGVVRNNWYKFTLKAINSIGTSIAEHGERIVPNRVTTNDQSTFNVEVIGWNEINMTPSGGIELPQ